MSDTPSRDWLPMPAGRASGTTAHDRSDVAVAPIRGLRPPAGAPNVVVVLLDDVGFAASSAFGGPCRAPTAERLAAEGLTFNRFHTTAQCLPTRQALLTGRNDHGVGMGGRLEHATAAPRDSSLRPDDCAPLAETLRLNGYATAQFDTTPPEQGCRLADRAIGWVSRQRSLAPDKPFFVYLAPRHAPHDCSREYADRYRGRFDSGWDALRERTLLRQKQLGVVPPDAELTARPGEIPRWLDIPDALKPALARRMEVYAGVLEHIDHHVGRLVDALADLDVLEDTLVYYIIGDGGSAVSSATGWAHAMVTPYQGTEHAASHWGATRTGAIVHWPAGTRSRGAVRAQFHHVVDVAPTVLDVAGVPAPTFVHGIRQRPLEGVSMRYCFDAPQAAERRTTQCFEMHGSRAVYHEGWTAVTRHSAPAGFDDDVWELYDTTTDWSQAQDLAAEHPTKLEELKRLLLVGPTQQMETGSRTSTASRRTRTTSTSATDASESRWRGNEHGTPA